MAPPERIYPSGAEKRKKKKTEDKITSQSKGKTFGVSDNMLRIIGQWSCIGYNVLSVCYGFVLKY